MSISTGITSLGRILDIQRSLPSNIKIPKPHQDMASRPRIRQRAYWLMDGAFRSTHRKTRNKLRPFRPSPRPCPASQYLTTFPRPHSLLGSRPRPHSSFRTRSIRNSKRHTSARQDTQRLRRKTHRNKLRKHVPQFVTTTVRTNILNLLTNPQYAQANGGNSAHQKSSNPTKTTYNPP